MNSSPRIAVESLAAFDVHVHLESADDRTAIDTAAKKYFGDSGAARDANALAEYYRSRKIAFVIFAVDERLVSAGKVRGLKLHPPVQKFIPSDSLAYPLYEIFAEAQLPVIFHTGHSGLGTGMPGGGGVRLKYGHPMPIDDVAVDFPSMPIIMAHPSFPWQDEAISICLHKPQVYIDLSGWSPRYFAANLIQYANTLLKHKMLFGSDYPLITPDKWMAEFEKIAIRDEVRPLILKQNAIRLLG